MLGKPVVRRAVVGTVTAIFGVSVIACSSPAQRLGDRRPAASKASMAEEAPSTLNAAGPPGGPEPPRAINLRDLGEVSPFLKKGVFYRCSQVADLAGIHAAAWWALPSSVCACARHSTPALHPTPCPMLAPLQRHSLQPLP